MINTVTLCGSTRFAADFAECNRELTKRGLSIITISFAAEKDTDGIEKEQSVKELLDLVHFNKILRSDAIVIVGDGYIGFSTAREILWANMQGKLIIHQKINGPLSNKMDNSYYNALARALMDEYNDRTRWTAIASNRLRELDAAK